MLEKIKGYLLYIVLPITALFGFIYKLLTDNRRLKDQIARDEITDKLKETMGELKDAKKDADATEAEFRSALDEFKRTSGLPDESE